MSKYFYLIVTVLSIIGIIAIFNISKLLKEKPDFSSDGDEINIEEKAYDDDYAYEYNETYSVANDEQMDVIKPNFEISIDTGESAGFDSFYRLVAGTFGDSQNAEKMLKKIKDLGYQDAEIIKDQETNLSRVVVAEFSDQDRAKMLKEEIESSFGIEIFVKAINP